MTLAENIFDINSSNMSEEDKESHLLELLGNLGSTTDGGDHYETTVDGYIFWVDKETEKIKSKGPEKTVELTGIKVKEENKNITVYVGQTKLIEIEVEPEGASTRDIEYTSSNNNIVEAKNGTITGKAEGTVTITIKSKKNSSITETINVTVRKVEVESISLKPTTLEIPLNGMKELPTVTFTPANATNKKITWSITSADPSGCITIDSENNKIKAGASAGTAQITSTTANGKTATCNITVADPLNVAMTIEDVKEAIKKDGLKAHLGQKVAYNPEGDRNEDGTAKGIWRVFYYNTEAEWGDPAGTLYLERDFDNKLTKRLSADDATINGIKYMKNMNPQWSDSENGNSVDLDNEKAVSWLYNIDDWTNYVTSPAKYAIGSASIEMYMKSYNIYMSSEGTVDPDENKNALMCKIGNSSGYYLGADGSWDRRYTSRYYG